MIGLEKIHGNVSTENVNAIAEAVAQAKYSKAETPVLKGQAVNLIDAPVDLEALAAKLGVEVNDARANVARSTLGSEFARIIANSERNIKTTGENMKVLSEAKTLNEQLKQTEKNIEDKSKEILQLQQEINETKAELNALQTQSAALAASIATTTDPEAKTKLKAQKTLVDAQINDAVVVLGAKQASQSTAKLELLALQDQKTAKAQEVKSKLSELKDTEIIEELNEALRNDAKNKIDADFLKQGRYEELEKWLEKHSPYNVIQQSLIAIDEINSKKEEKV